MNPIDFIISGAQRSHWLIEAVVADAPEDILFWQPEGTTNSIGALYLHTSLWQDHSLNNLIQQQPMLWEREWSRKLNLPHEFKGLPEWEWSSRVRYDLAAVRGYTNAVHEATMTYLATLKPEDLDQKINAGVLGPQPLPFVINARFLWHKDSHGGEIACLKGMRGLKGLPV